MTIRAGPGLTGVGLLTAAVLGASLSWTGPGPRRPDLAWHGEESDRFGTDEFMAWCAAAGVT